MRWVDGEGCWLEVGVAERWGQGKGESVLAGRWEAVEWLLLPHEG